MQKPLSQTEIQTLAAIIDVCCQRGAFRAKEMVPAGNLYNRLTSMIVPENEKPTPDPKFQLHRQQNQRF